MLHRVKDKIRVNVGGAVGQRGLVEEVNGTRLRVRLGSSSKLISLEEHAITNYSAAARKAWKTMPLRSVGRPKGRTTNRRSVTLRLDADIWGRFTALEQRGAIRNRSGFIEETLDAKLGQLEKKTSDKKTHV